MNEINFLPHYDKRHEKQIVCMALIVGPILVLIIIAGFYIPYTLCGDLNNKLVVLQNRYSGFERVKTKDNTEIKNIIEFRNLIDSKKRRIGRDINTLKKYIVNGTLIQNIKYDDTGLLLSGSGEYFSVIKFVGNMEKSKKYKNVRIVNMKHLINSNFYSFVVDIKV